MTNTSRVPPSGYAPPWADPLTEGVLARRCLAWLIDLAVIACLWGIAAIVLFAFGVLTFGLGMPLLGLLSLVPFCYHWGFLAGMAATPGQALLDLRVMREADGSRPDPLQALISTLLYYLTLATSGLLLLVALVTERHRTLHDLASGLLVVRAHALAASAGPEDVAGRFSRA